MMMKKFVLALFAGLMIAVPLSGQVFGNGRPLYFIGGVPLEGPVDKTTANLKFQFGADIPVWSSIGGRNGLDLRFGYTQVSVWDFFDESSPFRDNTYIPGFHLSVPLERDRLLIGLEHRSNGRPMRGTAGDSHSRSVNYVYGTYGAFLPGGLVLKATLRGGFGWYDEEFTQEVFWHFLGYADFTAGYRSPDGRLEAAFTATPTFGPFDVNIDASAAWRPGKTVALFMQLNSGYGEALYDWVRGSRPPAYLRFGILLGTLL